MQKIAEHLLGLKANWKAGLGDHGDLLLRGKDGGFFKVTRKRHRYTETLTKLPKTIPQYSGIALDVSGLALVQLPDNTTVCYNNAGQEMYRLNYEGELITSVGGELFFKQEMPSHGWKIQVHRKTTSGSNPERAHITLQPEKPFGADLSVCHVDDGYAVADSGYSTLYIFNRKGNMQTRFTFK